MNDAPLLRDAGEGLGEAAARQMLRRATDNGLPNPGPGNDEAGVGVDRCRVLLRPPQ